MAEGLEKIPIYFITLFNKQTLLIDQIASVSVVKELNPDQKGKDTTHYLIVKQGIKIGFTGSFSDTTNLKTALDSLLDNPFYYEGTLVKFFGSIKIEYERYYAIISKETI